MNSKIFHISFLLFSKKVKNHLVQIVHGSKVKLKDLKNIKAKVMTGEDSSGGPSISRNVQPNGFGITMSEIQPYVFTESSGCLNVYNASEWGKCKTIS